MLRTAIVATVTRCTRHAWLVIALATLAAVISGIYAARQFAINTDIKVTSIKQPQSSCPFKSAREKVYGLDYDLLLFFYVKKVIFVSRLW